MESVNILDCTLRDGGYCNEWKFGKKSIKWIIEQLTRAKIDIIECGFLTNKVEYNEDVSLFSSLEEICELLPNDRAKSMYVCMMNYGEYDIKSLPQNDESSIDGIRVAFHKKDMIPALDACEKIAAKGYKVFIQAMVSLSYSDEEFLELIYKCNKIHPYAFYIVDSFGVMRQKDLIRLFYMVEHNLDDGICIGYHSHNNMQLSYSNAQTLTEIATKRRLIIDASVYGMGRGAGNLNTELFVEYLNDLHSEKYVTKPLLSIIDEVLNPFYQKNYWGYSLPNYLSAAYNIHPNYAKYLDDKKTLTIDNMDDIFSSIIPEKKEYFDKIYIEQLYREYMAKGTIYEDHVCDLKKYIQNKDVLIIAPGKSSLDEAQTIVNLASQSNIVSFGVNFNYKKWKTDFIFLSNLRRYRDLDASQYSRCIVTSNIPIKDDAVYIQTEYQALTNQFEYVSDNAGLMLIKFLISMGVTKVFIAGMDGYSLDSAQNYFNEEMNFAMRQSVLMAMNKEMHNAIEELKKQIIVEFITKTLYI